MIARWHDQPEPKRKRRIETVKVDPELLGGDHSPRSLELNPAFDPDINPDAERAVERYLPAISVLSPEPTKRSWKKRPQ